jgi:membrane-associated phospholipid phosphatase
VIGLPSDLGESVTEPTGRAEVQRSRGRRLLRAVAASAASVVPVSLLAFGVRQQFDPVITADQAAIRASTRFSRAHDLTPALLALQRAAQPAVVHSASTIVVVFVGKRKRLGGRALWAFATMMTGWAVGGVAKVLVRRLRPVVDEPLSHSSGYSFPSAHALNAAVAGSAMTVFGWPLLRRSGRWVAVAAAAVCGLAVGLNRIFLGVHFPSDVIAGWLLGVGVTVVSWTAFTSSTAATSSRAQSHPA